MRNTVLCIAAGLALATGQRLLRADDAAGAPPRKKSENAFVNVLWLVQAYGTSEANELVNDSRTKKAIAAALQEGTTLTSKTIEGLMEPDVFARLAGDEGRIGPEQVDAHLDSAIPETRRALLPAVAAHLRLLTTSFDQIDELHRQRAPQLVDWIVENFEPGKPLPMIFVCTGNSRRSILGATLGNVAAAYFGLPEIRCYSGGTKASAFNVRTVATLREIGVEIKPTGRDLAGGAESEKNPVYKVRWGDSSAQWPLETTEFSKRYDDPHNPRHGFAALIVCSEADASCPTVDGAALRVAMPYIDPKLYDGSEFEPRKYAERRDDMGRLMLSVMLQARLRLIASGKLAAQVLQ